MQQHHYQHGNAIAVLEAHETRDDDKLRLTLKWGYANQGISASMLMEGVDEQPRVMRKFFTMKRPDKNILLLLLVLIAGCAMEMVFLLHLLELEQISLLLR